MTPSAGSFGAEIVPTRPAIAPTDQWKSVFRLVVILAAIR